MSSRFDPTEPREPPAGELILKAAWLQVRELEQERRPPREVLVGIDEWVEIVKLPIGAFAGAIAWPRGDRMFGIPLRVVPLKSCLEVLP